MFNLAANDKQCLWKKKNEALLHLAAKKAEGDFFALYAHLYRRSAELHLLRPATQLLWGLPVGIIEIKEEEFLERHKSCHCPLLNATQPIGPIRIAQLAPITLYGTRPKSSMWK